MTILSLRKAAFFAAGASLVSCGGTGKESKGSDSGFPPRNKVATWGAAGLTLAGLGFAGGQLYAGRQDARGLRGQQQPATEALVQRKAERLRNGQKRMDKKLGRIEHQLEQLVAAEALKAAVEVDKTEPTLAPSDPWAPSEHDLYWEHPITDKSELPPEESELCGMGDLHRSACLSAKYDSISETIRILAQSGEVGEEMAHVLTVVNDKFNDMAEEPYYDKIDAIAEAFKDIAPDENTPYEEYQVKTFGNSAPGPYTAIQYPLKFVPLLAYKLLDRDGNLAENVRSYRMPYYSMQIVLEELYDPKNLRLIMAKIFDDKHGTKIYDVLKDFFPTIPDKESHYEVYWAVDEEFRARWNAAYGNSTAQELYNNVGELNAGVHDTYNTLPTRYEWSEKSNSLLSILDRAGKLPSELQTYTRNEEHE